MFFAQANGGVQTWMWIVFAVGVAVMLVIDLRVYPADHSAEKTRRAAMIWTIIWIAAGLGFGVFVWAFLGARPAQEYFAAYAIEKGLSLDNIFVFYVIFKSLAIPARYQHKVLFWGILGAVFFRAVFIFLGSAALERWEWVTWIFAGIMLLAAWHSFREDPGKQKTSRVVRWLARRLPVTEQTDNGRFMERVDGRWVVTPLVVALIAIELTDIMFAIDSVPAALSITRDRFVVYSSNLFAILGLRMLYLYLSSTLTQLRYLHYGLAAVLAFAALKIITHQWVPIHPLVSLAVIVLLLGTSVWASLHVKKKERKMQMEPPQVPREG